MAQKLKRALAALSPNARGGGSPDFAQGGGVVATMDQLNAAILASAD